MVRMSGALLIDYAPLKCIVYVVHIILSLDRIILPDHRSGQAVFMLRINTSV